MGVSEVSVLVLLVGDAEDDLTEIRAALDSGREALRLGEAGTEGGGRGEFQRELLWYAIFSWGV